jgi:hypothetical protein
MEGNEKERPMRKLLVLAVIASLLYPVPVQSQTETTSGRAEELAESIATDPNENEVEAEDEPDLLLQPHGLSVNVLDVRDWESVFHLSAEQASAVVAYRKRFGSFIDLMELQAVPGWSINLVRRILPYVTVDTVVALLPTLSERATKGRHQWMVRSGSVLEKSRGYRKDSTGKAPFAGDALKVMIRYHYQYRQLMGWGLTMEKDAGETFLGHAHLPDLMTAHFFLRDLGPIRYLVVGDYQLNLGQGLTHWQSLAFRKSSATLEVLRQGPSVKPNGGLDENRFHRGMALGLGKGPLSIYFFIASDRRDAHMIPDSMTGGVAFTSMPGSGLHRTEGELRDRHTLRDLMYGARLLHASRVGTFGLNLIRHEFNGRFTGSDAPYGLYSFRGDRLVDASVDHRLPLGPTQLFGEWASDVAGHLALTEGVLFSPDARMDMVMLFRHFSPGYHAFQENAFGEGSVATNETGFYGGIEWRPSPVWRLNASVDRFRFPWLKFAVDMPSSGSSQLLKLTWRPDKKREAYAQFGWEGRPENLPGMVGSGPVVVTLSRFTARFQFNWAYTGAISLTMRAECSRSQQEGGPPEHGFLAYADLLWRVPGGRLQTSARFTAFHTDGYESRIYAYERQLLSAYGVPIFYHDGSRYYIMASGRLWKGLHAGVRLAHTLLYGVDNQGSGYDEIGGTQKIEWNLAIWSFF